MSNLDKCNELVSEKMKYIIEFKKYKNEGNDFLFIIYTL
jgi:hypothetical protein